MALCGRTMKTIALVAALGACGGSDGPGPGPQPASLAKQSGDNQVANAGSGITLEVIARDASNNPLAGVSVAWAAVSGGGNVSSSSTQTNASGIASVTRNLSANAGAHTTSATVTGLPVLTFNAVAQVQGATLMTLSGGNAQADTVRVTLPIAYSVLVQNQTPAPVAGVVVNWNVTAGGGTVNNPTSTTNASGIATITHTFGNLAGNQSVQASVAGLGGSPITFTSQAAAGNAAVLQKTSGDAGSSGLSSTVRYVVTVRDSYNNPKSGITIDWAATAGGGSIAPLQGTTSTAGRDSSTRTLSSNPGAHEATATASVVPATTPAFVTFTTTALALPTTATVTVVSNDFNPSVDTLAVGGQVTWNWASGGVSHNVTFEDNVNNSPTQGAGNHVRTFNSAATYRYRCTIHSLDFNSGMIGSIVIQ